uniref:Uncharacterized protein n=1 Tax=viral metagenome TaxID=1070528 RepID=A0A6C0KRQ9_9ZZZZ
MSIFGKWKYFTQIGSKFSLSDWKAVVSKKTRKKL